MDANKIMSEVTRFMKTKEGYERMNEISCQEWVNTNDPYSLLRVINSPIAGTHKSLISERKTRLISCAIARQRFDMPTNGNYRLAVQLSEKYSDHTGTDILQSDLRRTMGLLITLTENLRERPQSEERGYEIECCKLLQATIRTDTSTLLQKTIERARKCNIEDNVMCEIIRDIVGNPFVNGPKIEDYPHIVKVLNHTYNSPDNHGQLDLELLACTAYELEELRCNERIILDHLRSQCPYCKDLGNFQGNYYKEKGSIYDRGNIDIDTLKVHNHQCVCKGTRLSRHWKGNWVVDLLIGKN